MKLSMGEKRILLITFAGLLILLGFVLQPQEEKSTPGKSENARSLVEFPIDINTASYDELILLPGIGPTRARAIITYREENGAFHSINEVLNVSGIGETTLKNIQNMITVKNTHQVYEKSGKINVNTASVEDLCELPGIGEVKANEIVKYRENRGPFKVHEDLLQVPGIGPKTLERISNMIEF